MHGMRAQVRRDLLDIIAPRIRSTAAASLLSQRGLISAARQPHPFAYVLGKKTKKGRAMERRLLERNKVATTVYLSVPGGKFHRCRAKNLSAMGVFLEIKSLGLPAGTVVNLVFAVNLGDTIRLHRRKAVLAHVSERGAGLMMQGRTQLRPSA
jgi:hypothetical protein